MKPRLTCCKTVTDREGVRGLDVVDGQCVYGLLAEAAVTFHIGCYRLSAHFLVRHPHTEIVKTPSATDILDYTLSDKHTIQKQFS